MFWFDFKEYCLEYFAINKSSEILDIKSNFLLFFRTIEVQQELHEFRECSEEIEKELESQLEQNEQQMKDLRQQNTSLIFELETLKVNKSMFTWLFISSFAFCLQVGVNLLFFIKFFQIHCPFFVYQYQGWKKKHFLKNPTHMLFWVVLLFVYSI